MLYTIFIFFVFCNYWTNGQPGKFRPSLRRRLRRMALAMAIRSGSRAPLRHAAYQLKLQDNIT